MSIELTSKEIKASKPINAMQLDVTSERKIIHKQIIIVPKRAQFEIEFSSGKTKFFIVIKRRLETHSQSKLFAKTLFIAQAKQLLKLFNVDMCQMVNGLIKVNNDLSIDFAFIDKILMNMVGIKKDILLAALGMNQVKITSQSLSISPFYEG